jgi:hypothetical protein
MGVDRDTPYATKVLAAHDSNKDGTLSLCEFDELFKSLMLDGGAPVHEASDAVPLPILNAFRRFDADASGMMDVREVDSALKDAGLEVEPERLTKLVASFADAGQLNLEQFHALVKELSY